MLNGQFAQVDADDDSGLFGWQVHRQGDLPDDTTGTRLGAGLAIGGEGSGPVAEQTTLLRPGGYVLRWRTEGLARDAAGTLQWGMTCLGGEGKPQPGLAKFSGSGGMVVGVQAIEVPAGCAAQRLVLYYGQSGVVGGSIRLMDVDIGTR